VQPTTLNINDWLVADCKNATQQLCLLNCLVEVDSISRQEHKTNSQVKT